MAFSFAHNENRPGDVSEKMREANRDLLLIALVETAKGIENVNKNAATDGIDVIWIGNFNLANSLGIPAQWTHPSYLHAVERVIEASK